MSAVNEQVTRYLVSALPLDNPEASTWGLTVEWTGAPHTDRQWAVRRHSMCASRSGKFGYEPLPSSRSPYYLKTHRFTLDEALTLARKLAPKIVINGLTPHDVLRLQAERGIA